MSAPNAGGRAAPIAVVSHEASRTGAPIVLLNLWRELTLTGRWKPTFLCMTGGPLVDEFRRVGSTTVAPGSSRVAHALQRRLPEGLERSRQEILMRRWLRRQPRPAAVYLNTIAVGHLAAVARREGIPVVTHVHELEYMLSHGVAADVVSTAIEASDLLIAAAEGVRENLVARHGADSARVVTVRESIPLQLPPRDVREPQRHALGVGEDEIVVLGAGTAEWRKGADLFVQVAIRALRSQPKLRFVWVGHVRPEDLARYQHDLRLGGAQDRVAFVGESARPGDYFVAADIFCLTSREDPYPLVMLEAAAAGLPVVGFAGSGGVEEFVSPGGGVVVEYLDVEAMAIAIDRLAGDDHKRAGVAEIARGSAQGHSVMRAADAVEAVLARVVKGG